MYFVSRQLYWPSGDSVVEICTGGKDYCNPDMLFVRFPKLGEGQEFTDPMEAVEAAINIRDAWNRLFLDFDDMVRVEVGNTGGYTMPFEEYPTDEQLRDWAKKALESLPKCGWCNDILGDERYHLEDYPDDDGFCSETCAELSYLSLQIAREEDVQEG